jgi:dihydroxyacetone kinase-like protein
MITAEQVHAWLHRTAELMSEHKDLLTALDAAIGDADHGINMERGFKKVISQIKTDQDIPTLFKTAAMALISSVGGAGGPLYGTFFLKGAAAAAGKSALDTAALYAVFADGLAGVVQRGQAQPGDKTMVDALGPAVDELHGQAQAGTEPPEAVTAALQAAEAGLKATIPLQARKGRASYLGQRSIGHQDPGATSSCLVLQALSDVLSTAG